MHNYSIFPSFKLAIAKVGTATFYTGKPKQTPVVTFITITVNPSILIRDNTRIQLIILKLNNRKRYTDMRINLTN